MAHPSRAVLVPLLVLLGVACGDKDEPRPDPNPFPPGDIGAAIFDAPHVVAVEEAQTAHAGYRLFLIQLEQPVDHDVPGGATFEQFAALLWKGADLPVVLGTNGYGASRNPGPAELTALLGANQLTVEHRFFDPSSPDPKDWSRLTIEQAAADLHRVVGALRPVLGTGKWLSTGASKGGMTAVYHRYFHPDDVDGTVAYVAPQSFSTSDGAYVTFLEGVGGDTYASCRAALETVQHALLARRAEVQPLFEQAAVVESDSFDLLGADDAYTFSAVELSFAFWQYGSPTMCGAIPASDAPAWALFEFMNDVLGGVTSWVGDASLETYAAYYYQSATQLGGPAYPQDHLFDVLPGGVAAADLPELYPPFDVAKPWDATAIPAVRDWVSDAGEGLMFIYGEYDPWSANMFAPDPGNGSVRYVVPAGNHGARISRLPDAEEAEAIATLRSWAGLPPAARAAAEPLEFDPWVLLWGERGAPRGEDSANPPRERAIRLDGSGSAR